MTVFDDGSSPALYVGDSSFSDLESAKLHKWNGSTWSLVDHMSEGMVNALAVFDGAGPGGPDLFVGGRFHHSVAVGSYSWDIAQWLGCGPSGP
jgi:hypothetical protein